MKNLYYKLDENKNVVESNFEEWVNFIEGKLPDNYKQIDKDEINGIIISTIFIGLCHNHDPDSNIPIVFETVVFDQDENVIYMKRYSTWEDAKLGHERAMQWVREECKFE